MNRRNFICASLSVPGTLMLTSALPVTKVTRVNGVEVINAGIGGDNTDDILTRITETCLIHQPTLTIVKVGTNDMNSRKFIPLSQYEKNLRAIVQEILEVESQVVLMNLLPVHEPYLFTRHKPEFYQPEGHAGRLREMNSCIEKVAADHQLTLVDLHHIFQKAGNIGLDKSSWIKNEANSNVTDGLHPTPEGYRAIGLAVYQHLVYYRLNINKIVCLGDSITAGDGTAEGDNYPAWLKKLLN
jgi:lysophospholipase L1-like esterase